MERKLRLLTESRFPNLYEWAINEIDTNGKSVCEDQVPWAWSSYFTATEIVLNDTLSMTEHSSAGNLLPQEAEVSHERAIRIKLKPEKTNFRMFGTDRIINDFRLDILPLKSDKQTETSSLWGCLQFTDDNDFELKTYDDCLLFYLHVKSKTFNHYAERISSGTAEEIRLRVGLVSGFYSEWSPSISTREIKVLTDGDKHKVEQPEAFTLEVPRLGSAARLNVYINSRKEHFGIPDTKLDPLSAEDESDLKKIGSTTHSPHTVHKRGADLASIRWIIGLLVVLIVVVWFK